MDTSEMRELLEGYLNELNWAGGVTKDTVMAHLAGRDETLRTMVNQYVSEGTYQGPSDIMTLIPAQAWQDAQGDEWRGAESQYAEDVPSHFQEGRVGQDDGSVDDSAGHAGGSSPQTPGFGPSTGASSDASTGGAASNLPAGGTTAADAAAAGFGSGFGSGFGETGPEAAGAVDGVTGTGGQTGTAVDASADTGA